jgi:hypothetical protein
LLATDKEYRNQKNYYFYSYLLLRFFLFSWLKGVWRRTFIVQQFSSKDKICTVYIYSILFVFNRVGGTYSMLVCDSSSQAPRRKNDAAPSPVSYPLAHIEEYCKINNTCFWAPAKRKNNAAHRKLRLRSVITRVDLSQKRKLWRKLSQYSQNFVSFSTKFSAKAFRENLNLTKSGIKYQQKRIYGESFVFSS